MKKNNKTILEEMNPAITVNAEVTKSSLEYFVDTYATIRLTTKPAEPDSNRFLLSDMVFLYLI